VEGILSHINAYSSRFYRTRHILLTWTDRLTGGQTTHSSLSARVQNGSHVYIEKAVTHLEVDRP
jgi:hypothetical protein